MDFDNFNLNLSLFDNIEDKGKPVVVEYWKPVPTVVPVKTGRGKQYAINYVKAEATAYEDLPQGALLEEPKEKTVIQPLTYEGKKNVRARKRKVRFDDSEDSSSDYERGRLTDDKVWKPRKGWGYLDETKVNKQAKKLEDKTGLPFSKYKDAFLNYKLNMI